MFLATMFRAVTHESQEAALPALSLTQRSLHCLQLRVKANQKGAGPQASPNPAHPTCPALPRPAPPSPTQIHSVVSLLPPFLICEMGRVTPNVTGGGRITEYLKHPAESPGLTA